MKKTFLLISMLLLTASFCFGQFAEKGSMLFNGSLSAYAGKQKLKNSGTTSETKISSFSLSPTFQYFVIDNLAVGGMLRYSSQTSKSGDFKSIDSQLTIGPVARYYFYDAFFAQGYLGFGNNVDKSKSGGSTFKTTDKVIETVIAAGYSIRITETVLLDPMIGYWFKSINIDDSDGDYKQNTGQICIQIGFSILINR